MRVAQRMISRNYRRTVNSSLKKQADTLERSESGLKFKYLSDDVAAGARAMHVQEERYQSSQQLENVKELIKEMNSVDSNLKSVHSILQTVQERVLTGMSEDWGDTAREVIAKEIREKKEQILQFMNAQYGGKSLFSGTNNSTPPFTVSSDGLLQFNGIEVSKIYKSTADGKYYYDEPVTVGGREVYDINGTTMYKDADGNLSIDAAGTNVTCSIDADGNYTSFTKDGVLFTKDADGDFVDPTGTVKYTTTDGLTFDDGAGGTFTLPAAKAVTKATVVPNSGDTYADIGLGLKISNDQDADPRTAFQISFSGLSCMGYAGKDKVETVFGDKGTEVSGNIYDLLTQIENALDPLDKNTLDDCFTQLVTLTDQVGMVRTDLGNRMQYLELTETRLTDDITNMTALETDLISSDPAEEAIKLKECEYVWLAVMQLGSKILPASLLDFMS